MAVLMTEAAARQVLKQLEKRGMGEGLKLAVKKSGCTGYAYVVDYADVIGEEDAVFESFGAKLVVPRAHLDFLEGTTVDFRREGISEAFRFDNPNVKANCGCGESFAV